MILLVSVTDSRAAEVVDLRWEPIDFETGTVHVRRVKDGTPAHTPLPAGIAGAARAPKAPSRPSSSSRSGGPLTAPGFAADSAGRRGSRIGFKAHAHMLRHACGYSWRTRARYANAAGLSGPSLIQTRRATLRLRRIGSRVSGATDGDRQRARPDGHELCECYVSIDSIV